MNADQVRHIYKLAAAEPPSKFQRMIDDPQLGPRIRREAEREGMNPDQWLRHEYSRHERAKADSWYEHERRTAKLRAARAIEGTALYGVGAGGLAGVLREVLAKKKDPKHLVLTGAVAGGIAGSAAGAGKALQLVPSYFRDRARHEKNRAEKYRRADNPAISFGPLSNFAYDLLPVEASP